MRRKVKQGGAVYRQGSSKHNQVSKERSRWEMNTSERASERASKRTTREGLLYSTLLIVKLRVVRAVVGMTVDVETVNSCGAVVCRRTS